MPNRHAIRIAGMTAVLVAILGMPGAASASPLGGFKRAQFLVTAKGTQATTWSYHHTGVPGAICDFDASGSGTQTVRLHPTEPTRLDAYALGPVGGHLPTAGP